MTQKPSATALDVYNVERWGEGYFSINQRGEIVVRPDPDSDAADINLQALVKQLGAHGLRPPTLLRFTGILQHRLKQLAGAFEQARRREGYEGHYQAVYPIKVNQQRRVLEAVLNAPERYPGLAVGLEAGSKPELMTVLALARYRPSFVVCNGYKDRAYVRLALIGARLGHDVHIVVEKAAELALILEQAQALEASPNIGVRVRLKTQGEANWQNTGGEKSKFGLNAEEVLQVVDTLKAHGRLEQLTLLHFHLGSQIADVSDIQQGMREAAQFYRELRRLGAPIRQIDVGGGLGVDYEGTRSESTCSMNYSLAEYAHLVVHALKETCQRHELPHPDIITESGRAMTAHHAVLVTNVAEVESCQTRTVNAPGEHAPGALNDLWAAEQAALDADGGDPLQLYHEGTHALTLAQSLYSHGDLSLPQRAMAEQLYLNLCLRIYPQLAPESTAHAGVHADLSQRLADKLFVNFSLFQSLPDTWGIGQIFPILPVTELDKPLHRHVLIRDITCDSDGRIDAYVDGQGRPGPVLPFPDYSPNAPPWLAFFLVGAYQEILGDEHNLFAGTDSVDVETLTDGSYRLTHPMRGATVADAVSTVHLEPEALLKWLRTQVSEADAPEADKAQWLDELETGLASYTYLDP